MEGQQLLSAPGSGEGGPREPRVSMCQCWKGWRSILSGVCLRTWSSLLNCNGTSIVLSWGWGEWNDLLTPVRVRGQRAHAPPPPWRMEIAAFLFTGSQPCQIMRRIQRLANYLTSFPEVTVTTRWVTDGNSLHHPHMKEAQRTRRERDILNVNTVTCPVFHEDWENKVFGGVNWCLCWFPE